MAQPETHLLCGLGWLGSGGFNNFSAVLLDLVWVFGFDVGVDRRQGAVIPAADAFVEFLG